MSKRNKHIDQSYEKHIGNLDKPSSSNDNGFLLLSKRVDELTERMNEMVNKQLLSKTENTLRKFINIK